MSRLRNHIIYVDTLFAFYAEQAVKNFLKLRRTRDLSMESLLIESLDQEKHL